jgi:hypothetical protein
MCVLRPLITYGPPAGLFNRSSNKLFLLLRTTLIDLNINNFAYLESVCYKPRRLVISDSPDETR